MEVDIVESIHAIEHSDYIDYISSKLEEPYGEKEVELEEIDEKISHTPLAKKTQPTKEETKKQELDYSFPQMQYLSTVPVQICPIGLICLKGRPSDQDDAQLSDKKSDVFEKRENTLKHSS